MTKKNTVRVAQDNAVHDGKGGYLPKGHDLSKASPETLESLKAKGFAA